MNEQATTDARLTGKDLSDSMKNLRISTALTRVAFAEQCGLSVSILEKLESRRRATIKKSTARAIILGALRMQSPPIHEINEFCDAAGIGRVSSSTAIEHGSSKHADLRHELVATTPAGHSLIVFARQAGEIAEIWKSGIAVTNRQLDLLAESHTRLVRDERAARLLMGVPG